MIRHHSDVTPESKWSRYLLSCAFLILSVTLKAQPVLDVSGSVGYGVCNNCKLVAPNLDIIDPNNTIITEAKVYFSSGYINGQDILSSAAALPIQSTFNAVTGTLTLSGSATCAQYEAALQTVCYQNTSTTPISGQRVIYFVLGNVVYNNNNGHYYQLVNNGSFISWPDANNGANASNYFGLQGYLVTVTSQSENNFLTQLLASNAWMGASDQAQEGVWRWVTGCEGLEENGQGRHFSNQIKTGNCFAIMAPGVNGNYANWVADMPPYSGEPNDCGCNAPGNHCESYAHFRYDPNYQNGTWNDEMNSASSYIIEYGCMPGDPTVQTTGFVTVNVVPTTISATPVSSVICNGSSTTLTASGGASYTWSPPVGLNTTVGSTVIANPTATTSYNVIGTDINGCADTVTVTVTVNPPLPAPTVSNNGPLCAGTTLALTASGTNATYSWSGPDNFTSTLQNPQVANVTAEMAGTYSVTVTQNNCSSAPATTTVVVNPLPTVTVTPSVDTICTGQSTLITAAGANTYAWTPGTGLSSTTSAGVTASPITTITYTITGTSNNCSNTATAVVVVDPSPVITVSPTSANICSGQSIPLTATGASSYTWGPATGLSNTSGSNVTASPTSTVTYTITGTHNNGCTASTTTAVTVTPTPIITASANSPVCEGEDLQLSATSITGASYSWSGPAGYTGSVQNPLLPSVALTAGGNYIVTAALNGCTSLPSSVPVIIHPTPVVTATPSTATICEGTSVAAVAAGATGYSWAPLNNISAPTGSSVQLSPVVTTTYTVTGTDGNNCSTTALVNITVNASPGITIPVTICKDSSFTYEGQVINTAGNYPFIYKTIHDCDSTVTFIVSVADKPQLTFELKEDACINEVVQLAAQPQLPGVNHDWSVTSPGIADHTDGPAISVSFNDTGMAMITLVTNDGVCRNLYYDSILIHKDPIAEIQPHDNDICGGDTVNLEAYHEDGYSYMWNPSAHFSNSSTASASARILQSELIFVTVTNKWGCSSVDSMFLNADVCCQLFLPSAFTPNNDGKNDVFRIISYGYNELKTFSIYNRFGERVFETSDITAGWNGKYNNNLQDVGTYFYYVRYKCIDGKTRELKGDVILIR